MQIRKDGEIIYNSIDNTGSSDDAALGARYAKGRIDTIEGNFDNYFDKTEVLDLLEQKSAAQFVNQLPSTLADNTWYYSKKFSDGTDVPNDKRALYAKDSLGVTQYLGVVGDVDLTDYQTKTDNALDTTAKTVVGGINENKDAIDVLTLHEDVYNPYFESALCDACVFDFHDNGFTSGELKVKSTRQFIAQMVDPISGSRVFGYCDTTQYFVSQGATVYIEQRFTQNQGSNVNARKEFYRKGSVTLDSDADYKNWVASKQSSITWNAWVPIEYPMTIIPEVTITDVGRLRYCYYTISGGTLMFRGMYFASAQPNVEQTIWTLPVPMKSVDTTTSLIYVYPSEGLTGTARLAIKANGNVVTVVPSVTGEYRLMAHIPLGY